MIFVINVLWTLALILAAKYHFLMFLIPVGVFYGITAILFLLNICYSFHDKSGMVKAYIKNLVARNKKFQGMELIEKREMIRYSELVKKQEDTNLLTLYFPLTVILFLVGSPVFATLVGVAYCNRHMMVTRAHSLLQVA